MIKASSCNAGQVLGQANLGVLQQFSFYSPLNFVFKGYQYKRRANFLPAE
jgi:hypothetical protein